MPEDPNAESIKKLYYSISEVSEMLGVKPHVLRYWETQFGALRPKKSRAGNRMYRERDVEILRQIQDLLHVRRYTIAGARRELSRLRAAGALSAGVSGDHDDAEETRASDVEVDALEASDGDVEAIGGSAKNDSAGEVSDHEVPAHEPAHVTPPEPAPVLARASAQTAESRSSREADSDPIQTSLDVPRPGISRAALTELREEIVRLQEWLEQR